MNPLLPDIPEAALRQIAPLLPLAWAMAGAQMRDFQQRRGESPSHPTACLPRETAALGRTASEAKVSGGRGRRTLRTTVGVRVDDPCPTIAGVHLLCEKLSMREDVWCFVGAWTQVTRYVYTVGGEGTSAKGPTRYCCTVVPTPNGLSIQHAQLAHESAITVSAKGSGEAAPLAFVRKPRRPWSRTEDAANLLSDCWVRAIVGTEAPGTSPSPFISAPTSRPAEALAARLAQLQCHASEIWENHERLGDAVMAEGDDGGKPASLACLEVRGWCAAGELPNYVFPDRVEHCMEKRFSTGDGLELVVRMWGQGASFEQAERDLWANLRGEGVLHRDSAPAPPRCSATLEMACTEESPAPRLSRCIDVVRLLVSLQILPVPRSCVGLHAEDPQELRQIWAASYLARPLPRAAPDVLAKQLVKAAESLERLNQGRVCDSVVELLCQWGPLWADHGGEGQAQIPHESAAPGADPSAAGAMIFGGLRECPTSGSMPRYYRQAGSFVTRPKLFERQ